jgi:hypothetical protein
MYQMNTKCTKWSQIIPNVQKILLCNGLKIISTFSNLRLYKNNPNLDFLFENKRSGNAGVHYRPSSAFVLYALTRKSDIQ